MVILWGEPKITVTGLDGDVSKNLDIPTPVADSTQLSTETGDKHTADIEGGGYEAVRYDKNTFTLEFSVRFAKGRTMPFEDVSSDGSVTGEYKIVLTSKDAGAPSMTMNRASVRYEDEYSADDGASRHYYAESLVPDTGDQIEWAHAETTTS